MVKPENKFQCMVTNQEVPDTGYFAADMKLQSLWCNIFIDLKILTQR